MRREGKRINDMPDFDVYDFIFATAAEISDEIMAASKNFPKERIYLADQVRKHSRMVCVNLEEAWRMREHGTSFIDKLSEAAQAASRTQNYLKFASKHNYLDRTMFKRLDAKYEDIFALLCDGAKN